MHSPLRFELAKRAISRWNIPQENKEKILPRGDFEAAEKVLFIHHALKLLFPENREIRDGWIGGRKKNLDNKRPIDIILASPEGIDEVCGILNQMLHR